MDTEETDFLNESKVVFEENILLEYKEEGNGITEANIGRSFSEFNHKEIKDDYFDSNTVKHEVTDIKIKDEDHFKTEYSGPEHYESSEPLYRCHIGLGLEQYKNYQEISCSIQKKESSFEDGEYEHGLYTAESIVKPEFVSLKDIDFKIENEENSQLSSKSLVLDSTKGDHTDNQIPPLNMFSGISTNNRLSNLEDPSAFNCPYCSYQTDQIHCIFSHILTHKSKTLQCPCCPYKANKRSFFKLHKLLHIQKEEVELHKCPKCSFTSKWKDVITKHLLIHEKPDIWYHCPECSYKTKYKSNLQNKHMVIHKNDQLIHKCTLCSYESSTKVNLQLHLRRVHRPKDVPLICCAVEGCSFKTYDKVYLGRHVKRMHK